MLRIPSFRKGNGIHRQYQNVIKSKAIVSGMAVTSFYVAARAAMAHEAFPATFFGISTCHFIKRRKEFSYIESQLRPELMKIIKRALKIRYINKLPKGDM